MARIPITAAVLETPGEPLRATTVYLDEPGPGEVLVRTEAAGLCHSDLHYLNGSLAIVTPVVLGHEVVGRVDQVGTGVTRLRPGDRVVATVTPSCGACSQCVSGHPTQCLRVGELRERAEPLIVDADGVEVGSLAGIGAFAEAFVVREAALALVTDDVDPLAACLLGCCISTGVGAVVHGAAVSASDTVLVIGCGGVGMAAIQGARICGARRIVAVDLHPEKLELARQLGATDVILASDDVRGRVDTIAPNGVTRAFEAVGRPATAELAFSLLAPGGVATILGLMPEGSRINVDASALIEGDRKLQGAYMGGNRFLADIDLLTDHHRTGRLDLESMVTGVVSLNDINDGFDAMRDPQSIRTVVDFRGKVPA
ncbi:Zn-dependent alcohol dehydrogenase [Leifsonia virtsii]|uniref:Zn-dependent alcohol dehydrogenase n=1 Tax=Leifsonia virtsii TaxID=3035915 RepID=A0ABT8IWD4_9MICO|nr:Zn-dependent alcohol dehydrogenase [Leifsonia virtsii]MDN4596687.1 Zn-dependent alcohol dehydrogenase [Leifsonia virtsii]